MLGIFVVAQQTREESKKCASFAQKQRAKYESFVFYRPKNGGSNVFLGLDVIVATGGNSGRLYCDECPLQ